MTALKPSFVFVKSATMADLDTSDLDAQIAKLQEERAKRMAKAEAEQRRAEASAATVLIGATPTKGELALSR